MGMASDGASGINLVSLYGVPQPFREPLVHNTAITATGHRQTATAKRLLLALHAGVP